MILKSNQFYIFLTIGFIVGLLLALCKLTKIDSYFPYIWLNVYGIMFLLATSYTPNLKSLFLTTFIPSALASLSFFWIMNNNYHIEFSSIILSLVSAQALNAFHLNYIQNSYKFKYQTLFQAVWESAIQLLIALLFSGLCYIILYLAATLFKLVQLTFLDTILTKEWFLLWSQAFFVSVGLLICTQTQHIIQSIRNILALICKYLFIPLALIGLIFITLSAKTILTNPLSLGHNSLFLSISFLCIIFINGIYQDGQTPNSWLFNFISRLFLIITPIFAFLPLLATVFNTSHSDNFLLLLNISLLFLYNISYAIIALLNKSLRLKRIEKANIFLAFIVIITSIVITNPWTIKLSGNKMPNKTPILYKPTATRTILDQVATPDESLDYNNIFEKYGLYWSTTAKNALTLGINQTPIYFCRPQNIHNFGGVIINNQCKWIDNKHTIQTSTNFTYLSGAAKILLWQDFKRLNNKKSSKIFQLDDTSKNPATICRLIYQNHIVIGTSSQNNICEFIDSNAIIKETNLVQFLYIIN